MKTLNTIFHTATKKNIKFYPNFSFIISLVLILFGTGMLDLISTCYAQSPWTQKEATMSMGRWELSTCVVDGKIYAIGGARYSSPLDKVEVYDPATDAWTAKSDMPTARQGLSTSMVNGKIYAIGGGDISAAPDYKTFSTVEEYDPETDTWITKSPMSTERGFHSANVLDGKIYVIGGSSGHLVNDPAILAVEVYDPATDTWAQKGDIPERIAGGFTSVVDGKIYAFGGAGSQEKVHEYDPVTDTWISKADIPTGRVGLSTSVLDGKIYTFGGHIGTGLPSLALATVEIYDPVMDTWTKTSDMLTARVAARTSVVNGKIYVIGGYTGEWLSAMCATVEEYDPHLDLSLLIEKTDVDKSCAKEGIDSVCITTKISETTGITLLAEIEAPDQTPVDSLMLFDDGNHNDGNAGDGLYANVWTVSNTEERQYFVDLQATRIATDTVIHHINNMASFTTIGPVVLENYTLSSSDTIPEPGDKIYLKFTLRNNGSTTTATNVAAKLISLNPLVSVDDYFRNFGDIAAGEKIRYTGIYPIEISEECPGNTEVSIAVDISSNDYVFWKDTFSIHVQGHVNIEDITEPITRIYPNPADDILNIEISNKGKLGLEIEIFSITGALIFQKEYKNIDANFAEQIDLSGYAKGIYMLKVRQADAVYIGKVVVR